MPPTDDRWWERPAENGQWWHNPPVALDEEKPRPAVPSTPPALPVPAAPEELTEDGSRKRNRLAGAGAAAALIAVFALGATVFGDGPDKPATQTPVSMQTAPAEQTPSENPAPPASKPSATAKPSSPSVSAPAAKPYEMSSSIIGSGNYGAKVEITFTNNTSKPLTLNPSAFEADGEGVIGQWVHQVPAGESITVVVETQTDKPRQVTFDATGMGEVSAVSDI